MNEIVLAINVHEVMVGIGGLIGILASTPPALKRLHPVFRAIRNYALSDIISRLSRVEDHAARRSVHVPRRKKDL